ncbi:reverse transcriptase domain-containing protein [Tanacetum coccineum]|uniref:Reverse transcriptase domain-containing protein n=1 Tax=Tanacetum coccineum TaxID=301880 RepID=A0ABQ5IZK6_9ASTR
MGVQSLTVNVDSKLVASQINSNYEVCKENIIRYLNKAREYIGCFKSFKIQNIPRNKNQNADVLSKLASVAFNHLTKEILVETLDVLSTNTEEINTVVEEEGETWMTPIINCLEKGIWPTEQNEARALRMKISYNEETPYSLTFGSEAVIPTEIGMPTHRTMMIKEGKGNEEELRLNLDLLTERREAATIREARYKKKVKQYYNKRVHPMSFKVGEHVYRKNEANRVENLGKLGPKWEGPYLVVETYQNGSYKLRTIDDREVPRVWHAINLRKCYL